MITEKTILKDEGKTLVEIYQFKLSRLKGFQSVLNHYLSETIEKNVKELIQNRLKDSKLNIDETEQMLKITKSILSLLIDIERKNNG